MQTGDWNAPHLSPAQIDYAAIDAVVAWRIAEKILPRFDVQRSAYEIQIGAVPAAMRMEKRGFKLDVEAHAQLIADLGRSASQPSRNIARPAWRAAIRRSPTRRRRRRRRRRTCSRLAFERRT